MVRVLGNSPERIRIADLNDVIYYRQQKEYTDQEFDSSRDLRREIEKGRVTVLENYQPVRSSVGHPIDPPVTVQRVVTSQQQSLSHDDIKRALSEVIQTEQQTGSVDPTDIRKIVSEVISESTQAQGSVLDPSEIRKIIAEILAEVTPKSNGIEVSAALQALIPLIADTVRQEVSKIQVVSSSGSAVTSKPVSASTFIDPGYIPAINIDGMKSSVKGEERTASGGGLSSSLDALKRLKKST